MAKGHLVLKREGFQEVGQYRISTLLHRQEWHRTGREQLWSVYDFQKVKGRKRQDFIAFLHKWEIKTLRARSDLLGHT